MHAEIERRDQARVEAIALRTFPSHIRHDPLMPPRAAAAGRPATVAATTPTHIQNTAGLRLMSLAPVQEAIDFDYPLQLQGKERKVQLDADMVSSAPEREHQFTAAQLLAYVDTKIWTWPRSSAREKNQTLYYAWSRSQDWWRPKALLRAANPKQVASLNELRSTGKASLPANVQQALKNVDTLDLSDMGVVSRLATLKLFWAQMLRWIPACLPLVRVTEVKRMPVPEDVQRDTATVYKWFGASSPPAPALATEAPRAIHTRVILNVLFESDTRLRPASAATEDMAVFDGKPFEPEDVEATLKTVDMILTQPLPELVQWALRQASKIDSSVMRTRTQCLAEVLKAADGDWTLSRLEAATATVRKSSSSSSSAHALVNEQWDVIPTMLFLWHQQGSATTPIPRAHEPSLVFLGDDGEFFHQRMQVLLWRQAAAAAAALEEDSKSLSGVTSTTTTTSSAAGGDTPTSGTPKFGAVELEEAEANVSLAQLSSNDATLARYQAQDTELALATERKFAVGASAGASASASAEAQELLSHLSWGVMEATAPQAAMANLTRWALLVHGNGPYDTSVLQQTPQAVVSMRLQLKYLRVAIGLSLQGKGPPVSLDTVRFVAVAIASALMTKGHGFRAELDKVVKRVQSERDAKSGQVSVDELARIRTVSKPRVYPDKFDTAVQQNILYWWRNLYRDLLASPLSTDGTFLARGEKHLLYIPRASETDRDALKMVLDVVATLAAQCLVTFGASTFPTTTAFEMNVSQWVFQELTSSSKYGPLRDWIQAQPGAQAVGGSTASSSASSASSASRAFQKLALTRYHIVRLRLQCLAPSTLQSQRMSLLPAPQLFRLLTVRGRLSSVDAILAELDKAALAVDEDLASVVATPEPSVLATEIDKWQKQENAVWSVVPVPKVPKATPPLSASASASTSPSKPRSKPGSNDAKSTPIALKRPRDTSTVLVSHERASKQAKTVVSEEAHLHLEIQQASASWMSPSEEQRSIPTPLGEAAMKALLEQSGPATATKPTPTPRPQAPVTLTIAKTGAMPRRRVRLRQDAMFSAPLRS